MTEQQTHIPCAFVNGNPVKYGRIIGYRAYPDSVDSRNLKLTCVREVFYEHPDDVTGAMLLVVIKEFDILSAAPGQTLYPKIFMLLQAQELVKTIASEV